MAAGCTPATPSCSSAGDEGDHVSQCGISPHQVIEHSGEEPLVVRGSAYLKAWIMSSRVLRRARRSPAYRTAAGRLAPAGRCLRMPTGCRTPCRQVLAPFHHGGTPRAHPLRHGLRRRLRTRGIGQGRHGRRCAGAWQEHITSCERSQQTKPLPRSPTLAGNRSFTGCSSSCSTCTSVSVHLHRMFVHCVEHSADDLLLGSASRAILNSASPGVPVPDNH